MESSNTLLWFIVILVSTGMAGFLFLGWLKGAQWDREWKLKKKKL